MKFLKLAACITSASLLIACGGDSKSSDSSIQKLLNTNADIAYASYSDSVTTAKQLKTALTALKNDPAAETLTAAKKAWLVSREPYGQTEVYRFRNSPVDSLDVEGDINAWPLGEALIDYVKTNASDFGDDQVGVTANDVGINGNGAVTAAYAETNQTQNIIGNTNIVIDADLLEKSLSADDEHDVITGYHAIEFLLWGQDLNTNNQNTTDGTDRDLAINTTSAGGQRPLADFVSATANDSADRRHQFMAVVVDKLIADLEAVTAEWAPGATYRTQFTTITSDANANAKLAEILTGMGTLSEGELAGERMQIALSANSQEDEHSCFSDNTHRDIWLDAEGVSNSFTGTYGGYDSNLDGTDDAGTKVSGYGLDDYLASLNLEASAATLATALAATEAGYKAIDAAASNGQPFDVLIMEDVRSATGPVAVTIKALSAQATIIQSIATELKLGTVVEEDASDCDTTNPLTEC
jgi:putative iron-regulated protein